MDPRPVRLSFQLGQEKSELFTSFMEKSPHFSTAQKEVKTEERAVQFLHPTVSTGNTYDSVCQKNHPNSMQAKNPMLA